MSALTATSFLERNLAALGERNADVRERIAAVQPYPDLKFESSAQSALSGTLGGRQLCSKHRPLDEAARQVDGIDLVEHAAIVVLGFGLGYHVQRLAERAARATLIIVFEPDMRLLRSVFEQIDHSDWMKHALLLFVTDPGDRGALARKLQGAESILGQGVEFFEHPASRARLQQHTPGFTNLFTEFIAAAKTTLLTTLMRSVDTVRNLMLNLDQYAGGAGVLDLKNMSLNRPAIVVSAGPSLQRNMHLLKDAVVRDRCVLIAVQTTLKPLLRAGIKPHFVTALDYHEISRRFYEGLTADDLRDVTLIADPKAHPVILDSFPGAIRCCSNPFLDKLLGPLHRPMGDLPAGATVAHLAVYVARHLGCNPIALIGQDLGFTDGLYYAPGIAIHDVWAPELNPFNTIEMMEWQRIVRHRLHLHKLQDVHGKSIYTDGQMHTYLQQFERDFAQYKRDGIAVIDATEGGVAKQHTISMTLQQFLQRHVRDAESLPRLPVAAGDLDRTRLKEVCDRLQSVQTQVQELRDLSNDTASLLREMINDQNDLAKMSRHFERIDRNRARVEQRLETLELLNQLNQVGVFNRLKADRRLHMQKDLTPVQRQRAQLERDLANVTWIADAAAELKQQIDAALMTLRAAVHPGAASSPATKPAHRSDHASIAQDAANHLHASASTAGEKPSVKLRVAALIAVDPERNGLGLPRSLREPFGNGSVLQATLERVGQSRELDSIILIVPEDFDVEALVNRSRIGLPIEVERVPCSPFGPEHRAIAAARLWSDTCWRGGIAGISIYDEVLCPRTMWPVMQQRHVDAGLILGPDWPLINVIEQGGCDAVIRRHREHPQQHSLVFTQAPPGLCGCVISAKLMQELSLRNRLATVGGLLVYQPHAPQGDPIARDACVQVEHHVRRSLGRFTFDSPRQISRIRQLDMRGETPGWPADVDTNLFEAPQHVTLELTTSRVSRGVFRRQVQHGTSRPPLSVELARRIFSDLAGFGCRDMALTLDGIGDPLLHPQFDAIIAMARDAGFAGIHLRTELLVDQSILDRLLACDVDVVSVDLNADRAATYQKMMGVDRFKDALQNIEYLLQRRTRLTDHPGTAAFALPWIVPRLQRRSETYEDIDTFFDRWQHYLGTAVIEGPPPADGCDTLAPAVTPAQVLRRDQARTLAVLCDGSVPLHDWDVQCETRVGSIGDQTAGEVWQRRRQQLSERQLQGRTL